MKPLSFWLIILLLSSTLLFLRCSDLALGGGGTETGSPGMFACAYAVFNEIESPATWSPEHYLPAGIAQLDPERLSPAYLKKNSAQGGGIPSDSNLIIMRYRVDTLITFDSLCIDTAVIDSTGNTVSCAVKINGRTTGSINTHRCSNQIIIQDTIVYQATLLQPRVDSFFIKLTDAGNAPVRFCRDSVTGMTTVRNNGFSNPGRISVDLVKNGGRTITVSTGQNVPLPQAEVKKTNLPFLWYPNYTQLVRASTSLGYIVDETYDNGDGVLLKTSGPLSPRSHLLTIFRHPEGTCTVLSVLFDAGTDRKFRSTGNNRIVSLDREQSLNNRTVEKISYRNNVALSAGDSIELIFDKHQDSGMVKDATVRYTFIPGADTLDYRSNRISRIAKALSFRDRKVQSLDLHIAFDASGCSRPFYDFAWVTARMYYGHDRSGEFEGYLNGRDNKLVGTYCENGVKDTVEYVRASNRLFWGER
jgi:hypothetical protein